MATLTFYGPLSDVMGRERSVDIGAEAVSLKSLMVRLEKEEPAFRAATERMRIRFAKNNVFASPDDLVVEGDDIAFLPPFSGG